MAALARGAAGGADARAVDGRLHAGGARGRTGRQRQRQRRLRRLRGQGITLVHFSPQPVPFLSL